MSQTAGVTKRAVDPSLLPPRWTRVLRSAVLFIVGLVITFTATFHEQLGFDLSVVAAALGVIGVVHLVEAVFRRGRSGIPIATALGLLSLLAATLLVILGNELAFVVVIAAWALASALLEFLGSTILPGSRQDSTLVGAAGLLLALTVLLSRGDLVAVIGFFGAYAVIAGVFLGIAAFDTRRATASEDVAQGTAVNA
ncbi:DUF308 domain-containing protein [Leucobacter komagatae]|uniref:DUF308 domain-containing protein n=1 Tax=Leucobacter komagatae TaxID=55969 RepID=A0A0D0HUY2_9MICO|nr:hypothetical protein [Leucobacter komagatae]KIP51411.1 hypothetical protein SD72_15475 [Leucobacter komagatae]